MPAAGGSSTWRAATILSASRIRASLIGTANLLWSLPRPADLGELPPRPQPGEIPLVDAQTAWGPARRVAVPGEIQGITPELRREAGPLGRDEPAWLAAR